MVVFDTLQELSVGEENCYQLSHLSLDFRHLLWFLLHPAAALFEQEDPCNSCSFLSHRLCPTHLCLPWVNSARGNGEETWVFLLHFPAGNLHWYWKPSQAQRLPSRSCLMAPVTGGWEETCGQGWHLWQLGLCDLGCINLGYQAEQFFIPTTFPLRLSLVCLNVNCAVVIHTYCMCYMEVENIKLGCFDLLNTLLFNLKQHSAISSNFFLPKCGKSASTSTFIWLSKCHCGSPRDGWQTQWLLQPVALSSTKWVLKLSCYLRAWHCSWR